MASASATLTAGRCRSSRRFTASCSSYLRRRAEMMPLRTRRLEGVQWEREGERGVPDDAPPSPAASAPILRREDASNLPQEQRGHHRRRQRGGKAGIGMRARFPRRTGMVPFPALEPTTTSAVRCAALRPWRPGCRFSTYADGARTAGGDVFVNSFITARCPAPQHPRSRVERVTAAVLEHGFRFRRSWGGGSRIGRGRRRHRSRRRPRLGRCAGRARDHLGDRGRR